MLSLFPSFVSVHVPEIQVSYHSSIWISVQLYPKNEPKAPTFHVVLSLTVVLGGSSLLRQYSMQQIILLTKKDQSMPLFSLHCLGATVLQYRARRCLRVPLFGQT